MLLRPSTIPIKRLVLAHRGSVLLPEPLAFTAKVTIKFLLPACETTWLYCGALLLPSKLNKMKEGGDMDASNLKGAGYMDCLVIKEMPLIQ